MRAAAALAFAVALRMRAAGRGGSEDEVEEVDEAEDEEEVVDAGRAVMRAGLWAASSAAATAGRMEGMSSGCRLGVGGWGGPVVTWRPGGPIWSAAAGEGGAGLWPSLLGSAGPGSCNVRGRVGWCPRAGTVRVGCIQGWGGWAWVLWGVFGGLGRATVGVGVPRGAGLPSAGVCGLSSVGGGEWCTTGGCVAGVCWCSGGWGRPVSRGPGVRAMVGVCGSPVEQREGGGMGGDCAVVCAVSVYVSACRALAWAVVGRAVWRRSLPSSAAASRISQTSFRIWWTSWSVVGRGYASFGLRPARLRTLWMAWYPQVRDCCGLRGGFGRVSGPAWTCVWAVGMAKTQGTVPVGGQRRWIQWVRQSMANPRW